MRFFFKTLFLIVVDLLIIAQSLLCVPYFLDKGLQGLAGISVTIAIKTLFTLGTRNEEITKKKKQG